MAYNSPYPQQPRNRDMGNAFRSHLLNKVGRHPADEYTTNGNGSPMPGNGSSMSGNGGIPIQPPGGGGSPSTSLLKDLKAQKGSTDALKEYYQAMGWTPVQDGSRDDGFDLGPGSFGSGRRRWRNEWAAGYGPDYNRSEYLFFPPAHPGMEGNIEGLKNRWW